MFILNHSSDKKFGTPNEKLQTYIPLEFMIESMESLDLFP